MTIEVRSNEKPQVQSQANEGQAVEPEKSQDGTAAPEAQASEQNTASESAPEHADGNEGVEHEEQETGDEAGETKATENGEQPGKKKGGFQRRIDKLNARNAKTLQELDYWKQQALKGAGDSKKETPVETKAADSEGKPDPEKFATHAEYVEALTDRKIEQKLKERDQRLEQSRLKDEQTKLTQTYQERLNTFKAKTEDFEETIENLGNLRSATVESILLKSENGPELLYELAKNPKEAERICRLSPLDAAREMGILEARIVSKSAATKTPETKTTTKAPAPVTPVGIGGKGSARKSITDPNISQREYEALRREQMKRRQA